MEHGSTGKQCTRAVQQAECNKQYIKTTMCRAWVNAVADRGLKVGLKVWVRLGVEVGVQVGVKVGVGASRGARRGDHS